MAATFGVEYRVVGFAVGVLAKDKKVKAPARDLRDMDRLIRRAELQLGIRGDEEERRRDDHRRAENSRAGAPLPRAGTLLTSMLAEKAGAGVVEMTGFPHCSLAWVGSSTTVAQRTGLLSLRFCSSGPRIDELH